MCSYGSDKKLGDEIMARRGLSAGAGRIIFGLMLLWLGTLFFLDEANIVESEPFWKYWPVAIVLFGVVKLITPGNRAFGALATIFGMGFLLDSLDIWEFDWSLVFPSLLVFAGGTLLWRGLRPRLPGASDADASEVTHAFAMLGGSTHRITSQNFRGGDATAMLGGVEIDLTGADVRGTATIDVFAMWGGIEIKVPESWSVELQGFPLLGAVEDSRKHPTSDPTKRLVVRGTAIMGGIEVK
jgi:hypothetical protein